MEKSNNLSKPHYELLDGLRGVAAIMIVIFHVYEILAPDLTKSPVAHGFLAVDFFFCLSGFVIGYAYDDRIGKIGIKQFFINRLIRLQPLVVLGTVFGLIALLLDPFLATSAVSEFGWGKIVLATLASVFLFPAPILGRFGNVFPLNAPAWSLSMEYIINIVYALVLVRLTKKWLLVLLGLSAVILFWVCILRGNLLGGWSGETYLDGYARVLFSFLAGLTIYRFRLLLKNNIHFLIYAAVLIGVFMFPHFDKDWYAELFFVVLFFPIIVAAGAGTIVSGWLKKLCVFLGNLSYPIYMMHYWMLWVFGGYAATNPGEDKLKMFGAIIVVGSILLAYFTQKLFDEPVRKWLTMKQKARNS